ncbi:hypothetical protein OIU85_005528 [Salix viminalis]|uniref:Uncharacterized protein n=1 Tax=Salix viminalis TaxID=40686 RepID=A0A9Q0PIZ9_SALVM|nr:hypothetical protein OIU85_005528 [Salix viminalis]
MAMTHTSASTSSLPFAIYQDLAIILIMVISYPQGGEPPIEQGENRDAEEGGGDIDVDQKLAENPVSKVETRLDHGHSREDSDAGWSTFPSLTDLQFDSCLSRSSMEKYVLQEDCSESYWIDDYVGSLLSWDGINFNNLE